MFDNSIPVVVQQTIIINRPRTQAPWNEDATTQYLQGDSVHKTFIIIIICPNTAISSSGASILVNFN